MANPLRKYSFFIFLTMLVLMVSPSEADVVRQANTNLELLTETTSLAPGEAVTVALRMRLDPEWHVYWLNPGDSGMAVTITWDLPEGYSATPIQWPVPKVIRIDSLVSYGYQGQVILLSEIQSPLNTVPGTMVTIKGRVDWLICRNECVPGRTEVSTGLPIRQEIMQKDPATAAIFAHARQQLPRKNLNLWMWSARYDGTHYVIDLKPNFVTDFLLTKIYFFPDDSKVIDHAAEQVFRTTANGYELSLRRSTLSKDPVPKLTGVLYAEPGWQGRGSFTGLEAAIPVTEKKSVAVSMSQPFERKISWLGLIGMAFLGGLILNLMPCVLPVLGLKVLQLISHSSSDRRNIWRHGGMFTLGIVSAFWILAGILLVLQGLGKQVGWGFQFQSSGFVTGLAVLFFILSLNLWGVFDIALPVTGLRAGREDRGLTASFANGFLATIVATPCTAPFMGTAIGIALSASSVMVFLIFSFLGLGMAFPVLILSRFPAGLRFLPKPGPWMQTLKMIFGWMLMLSVVWLSLVLTQLKGASAVNGLWLGFVFIGITIWLKERGRQRSRLVKFLPLTIMLLGVLSVMLGNYGLPPFRILQNSKADLPWRAYDETIVETLRQKGQPIFLDFTAAWCLTCQVNERLALENPQVIEAFRRANVALVKADWTQQDEKITSALARFGKNSIPFYVLYPSDPEAQPMGLPEVLTPGIILKAVESLENPR